MFQLFSRLIRDEKGAVLILTAFFAIVLIGIAGLVIDGGRLYLEKARLQRTVDAAALAGAKELVSSESNAKAEAVQTAEKNHDIHRGYIFPGDEATSTWLTVNASLKDSIEVIGSEKVELTFAKVLGFDKVPVAARAKVEVKEFKGGTGVIPMGIDKNWYKSLNKNAVYQFKMGDPLFSNGSDSEGKDKESEPEENKLNDVIYLNAGNFGLIDFGTKPTDGRCSNSGGGKDEKLKSIIKNGTTNSVFQGESFCAEPGQNTGPVMQGFYADADARLKRCPYHGPDSPNYDSYLIKKGGSVKGFSIFPIPETYHADCPLVVTVPVYQTTGTNGKEIITVLGFASFFITAVTDGGKEVYGKFIDYVNAGSIYNNGNPQPPADAYGEVKDKLGAYTSTLVE